jgi:hypothetical protein
MKSYAWVYAALALGGALTAEGLGRRAHPGRLAVAARGTMAGSNYWLPSRASDPVSLEDPRSGVAVVFSLRGASDAPAEVSSAETVLYPGALAGSDVRLRARPDGTEDEVAFAARPAREEVDYDVDVSRVPGLRLVSNTLEFLDEAGAPRLRVAPPFVVDRDGARTEASLALSGCDFDGNPRAPWGRAVTAPGAASCVLRVAWSTTTYPAVLDPAWTATGSLATARYQHISALLSSGQVLVAGGFTDMTTGASTATAELFDPTTGTFAATGPMTTARTYHAAALLASGEVLVAGGDAGFAPFMSAELYDPTAGTFTHTGSMRAARKNHTFS